MGRRKGRQWNRHGKRRRVRPDVFQESYEAGLTAEKFHEYYKAQKVVPEEEWDAFINTLSTALPVAFRISARDDRVAAKYDVCCFIHASNNSLWLRWTRSLKEKFEHFGKTIEPFEVDGVVSRPPV